jgi:glycosyltransferase involved in cell wall biosynthesis
MRRVLMISPHFPPDSTGATHRVRLLAPRLSEHGWEPTVLTVDPRDYEGALDRALADSLPADLRVVRARAWPAGVTRIVGIGDLGLRAFSGLWGEASALLAREIFDAVFITIYPAYTALLGPLLKRRFGLPFVLDYQDPWVGEWGKSVGPGAGGRPDLRSRVSRAIAARLEPLALCAADAVTAVSRGTFEPALRRNPGAKPLAVEELPIGWEERDFDHLRVRASSAAGDHRDGVLHLACIGTLPPTMTETLDTVFEAVRTLRERDPDTANRIRMHFLGTSNQRSSGVAPRALPLARARGVDDLVTETAGRLDYFDALQAFRDADALLLLGSTEAHYTPSRIFAALNSSRPVLAMYHADSPVTALLKRYGGPPSVRLITYTEARRARHGIAEVSASLAELVRHPAYDARAVDRRVLCEASAAALACRLAGVFDRVAAAEHQPA